MHVFKTQNLVLNLEGFDGFVERVFSCRFSKTTKKLNFGSLQLIFF